MTKKYNINELIDKKKDLMKQIVEASNFTSKDLTYEKNTYIDHTNKNAERVIEQKKRITLNDLSSKLNTAVEELAKVNVAILKHNASEVVELLQKRTSARAKLVFLDKIKTMLPSNGSHQRGISQKTGDTILESVEVITEPMFSKDDVDKQYNQIASQERELNTKIQKINLNAEVTLD